MDFNNESSEDKADIEDHLDSETTDRKKAQALIANEKYGGAVYFEDETPNIDVEEDD